MGDIATKIVELNTVKSSIKSAIASKGIDMTNVPFTEYASKIDEIETGGAKIYDLGTGTSFDVASVYDDWANLTVDNFYCVGFETLKIAGGSSQNYGDWGNAVQTEITQQKTYTDGTLNWTANVHSWNYDSNGTRNHIYGTMRVHALLII